MVPVYTPPSSPAGLTFTMRSAGVVACFGLTVNQFDPPVDEVCTIKPSAPPVLVTESLYGGSGDPPMRYGTLNIAGSTAACTGGVPRMPDETVRVTGTETVAELVVEVIRMDPL